MNSFLNWKKKLPSKWKALPLKAVANYSVSSVDKIIKEDEFPVLLCNYTDVYKNDFITGDIDFMKGSATKDEILKYKLEVGDVVITKDSESWDDIAIPALVLETTEDLICGYHLAIIKPDKEKINPSYLLRCLQSKEIRVQLELSSTGVTRYGLPKYEIGRTVLPIPTIEIQKAISFLVDNETGKIDKLIIAKTTQLKFLSEKRQTLITQMVTKGLNPKVKLKKSGTRMLGEIPSHWSVPQLKHLSLKPLQYGANEAALDENPLNPRFVRITDIDEDGNLRSETFKSLEPEIAEPYLLEDGDILFARSGATVGKTFMYQDSWGKACFAGYLIRMRCDRNKILPKFLSLIAQSNYYWDQVNAGLVQATIQNFSGEKYGSMKIILPPIFEQEEIVMFLGNELRRIDGVKQKTIESIELLKEKKIAFVSAAVTGQLEI